MSTVQNVDPEQLVEAAEAAKLLRIKPQTLAAWRSQSRGPEYLKVGRSVYYRRDSIGSFLAAKIVVPASA
jgi:hypothetical protein